jgi:hypothetical protein
MTSLPKVRSRRQTASSRSMRRRCATSAIRQRLCLGRCCGDEQCEDGRGSPQAGTRGGGQRARRTRRQAPVADYDGYGSCPLTVERGKIVLAEFGYGGKLLPSFPSWLLNGTRPTRAAWFLKERMLPRFTGRAC